MNEINTIVRFHDINRLDELDKCIFSLFGQTYRPITVIVAMQRFREEDIAAVRERLSIFVAQDDGFQIKYLNYDMPGSSDARSSLINMSMRACAARYVGFLDYDDTLYPEAYQILVGKLKATQSAIAFASVRVVQVKMWENFQYNESIREPFSGKELSDLFRGNFCPIHSYLIDRSKVEIDDFYFDRSLTMEEDYEFLIRITSRYTSDFSLVGVEIGDYYLKNDGSNSHGTEAARNEIWLQNYKRVFNFINARRDLMNIRPDILASIIPDTEHKVSSVGDFLRWQDKKRKDQGCNGQ